jgi:hypothetical protein
MKSDTRGAAHKLHKAKRRGRGFALAFKQPNPAITCNDIIACLIFTQMKKLASPSRKPT